MIMKSKISIFLYFESLNKFASINEIPSSTILPLYLHNKKELITALDIGVMPPIVG